MAVSKAAVKMDPYEGENGLHHCIGRLSERNVVKIKLYNTSTYSRKQGTQKK